MMQNGKTVVKNIMLTLLSALNIPGTEPNAFDYGELGTCEMTNESGAKYIARKIQTLSDGKEKLDQIFMFATQTVKDPILYKGRSAKYPYKGHPITHVAYFKERVRNDIPDIDDILQVYDYDENFSVEQGLTPVAEMAKKIQAYRDSVLMACRETYGADHMPDVEIRLYVDCSGGMRHANMQILDIVRLMQYTGIAVQELVYSNLYDQKNKLGRVENITSVYQYFDLIAGAEEFVRFGSVDAIQKYYENKKSECSPALKQLIHAMSGFAEEIKLCRYGQFTKAIGSLRQAVQNFDEKAGQSMYDALMLQLKPRIFSDYKALLEPEKLDDITLIRWCLERGYLQQAMTLYTERIPEVLWDNHIVSVTEKGWAGGTEIAEGTTITVEGFDAQKRDNELRSNAFFLFSEYNSGIKNKQLDAEKNRYKKFMNKQLKQFCQNRDWENFFAALETYIQSLPDQYYLYKDRICQVIQTLQDLDYDASPLVKTPTNEIIDALYAVWGMAVAKQKKADDFSAYVSARFKYGKQRISEIFKVLKSGLDEKQLDQLFFGLSQPKLIWSYEHGYIDIQADLELFKKISWQYSTIKNERNHSNHARHDESEFTAKSLKAFMLDALDTVQQAVRGERVSCQPGSMHDEYTR